MIRRISNLIFPKKCVLCESILAKSETDLCHNCRADAPEYTKAKTSISFVAGWTTVWYYKDNVRASLLRYKFRNNRHYASAYGRVVAMKILSDLPEDIDILSWIPVSKKRKFKRGYDQVQLLAQEVGKQLSRKPVSLLKKIRNTPAQSTLRDAAARRANVLGAYQVLDPVLVAGKTILLLDDIITTNATLSECAKILLFAGAKNVYCASVAAHNKK